MMQRESCELNATWIFDCHNEIVTTLIILPVCNESDMHGLQL